MKTHSPVAHTCRVGFAALACLALLAGCAAAPGSTDTPTETPTTAPDGGSNVGVPVTDYGTFVFDSSPFADPVIEGGIVPGDEFEERYYVTTITSADGTDRFNRTLLPSDAGEFVDNVSYVDASLVVIQAFPASSVPDYRVESVHRDGPTLVVSINDSSASGTTDVTVETVLLRVPGEDPDGVVVTTEEGDTFDTGVGYQRRRPSQGESDTGGCNSFTHTVGHKFVTSVPPVGDETSKIPSVWILNPSFHVLTATSMTTGPIMMSTSATAERAIPASPGTDPGSG